MCNLTEINFAKSLFWILHCAGTQNTAMLIQDFSLLVTILLPENWEQETRPPTPLLFCIPSFLTLNFHNDGWALKWRCNFIMKLQYYHTKKRQVKNPPFVPQQEKNPPEVPLQLSAGIQTASGSLLHEPHVPRKAISHGIALFVPAPLDVFHKV